MLVKRLIILHAMAGGLGALLGWVLSEFLQGAGGHWFGVALTCGLVGGAVGAALNSVAEMTEVRWTRPAKRGLAGAIIGGLAGAIGGSLGNLVFSTFHGTRAFGWLAMGAGLGAAEGLYERSPEKLRSGLIGGSIGGLIGGVLFQPLVSLLAGHSGAGSRAVAFVVLGGCVGVMTGVAKVIFAEAWLTVLDGDQPGRRLILNTPSVLLGRAGHSALPFTGNDEKGIDQEHARIIRRGDGRFSLEDNHSRHGTSVNLKRVLDPLILEDGDVIRIGATSIRFRQRPEQPGAAVVPVAPPPSSPRPAPVAPPARPTPSPVPVPVPAPAPAPVATTPTRPEVATPSKPARPVPRGMSLCPKCQRPVPGTRPYCVVCQISF